MLLQGLNLFSTVVILQINFGLQLKSSFRSAFNLFHCHKHTFHHQSAATRGRSTRRVVFKQDFIFFFFTVLT